MAEASSFVSELRRVVSLEVRTWSEIVRDNVDDVGPPPSVVEQLHLITGLVCDVARRVSVASCDVNISTFDAQGDWVPI